MIGALIEWQDSVCTRGWNEPIKDWPDRIISLGLIVSETDSHVVITTSTGDTELSIDQLAIPRAAILRMQRFEVLV